MTQTLTRAPLSASARPASRKAQLAALIMLGLSTALGACSPYMLRGHVIEGESSYALLVEPSDPRLQAEGVAGVSVRLTMDPGKLNRDVVADNVSGPEGEFELPVDRAGAGLITMDMSILARKAGYTSSEAFFKLPGSGSRFLLIVVAKGADAPGAFDEPMSADDEVRRFWSE